MAAIYHAINWDFVNERFAKLTAYTARKEQLMKRIVLFAVCLTALAVAVLAQGEGDYQKRMKTVCRHIRKLAQESRRQERTVPIR